MFHALSDGTRRAIVERLVQSPASVSTIAEPFDAALPTIVEHLKVLERAGIVSSEKVGRVRTYQLVPLLMALRQDPVRLLIADDVGIGKTIEAALIARELYDRGEIQRMAVLCPPHLVEQWVRELNERFHIPAVAAPMLP